MCASLSTLMQGIEEYKMMHTTSVRTYISFNLLLAIRRKILGAMVITILALCMGIIAIAIPRW